MARLTGAVSYIFFGLLFSILLYIGFTQAREQMYLYFPVENLFQASLVVPRFSIDEDPVIIYQKIATEDIHLSFSRELKRAETNRTVCRKQGEEFVTKVNSLNPSPITFDGFLGPECDGKIIPGQYYIETNYRILREGYPNRYLTVKSNLFTAYNPPPLGSIVPIIVDPST